MEKVNDKIIDEKYKKIQTNVFNLFWRKTQNSIGMKQIMTVFQYITSVQPKIKHIVKW